MSSIPGQTSIPGPEQDDFDRQDPEILERVMREVPRGALALAGLTVGLLVLAWFAVYLFVFLPRGSVG
jgi:hypothetical protein